MAKIIFTETGDIVKAFQTIDEAFDWIYTNCTFTLAWWTSSGREGAAYYRGEAIDLKEV